MVEVLPCVACGFGVCFGIKPRWSVTSKGKTVTMEVPAELAASLQAMVEHLEAFRARVGRGENPHFEEAEKSVGELVADLECADIAAYLEALDPSEERVEVGGVSYRRLHQHSAESYLGLRGPIRVIRGLYRQEGVKNGPTVVPMELRAGIVEGWYTPSAAKFAGVLAQEMPSRSTELVCRTGGLLQHGRASQFRVGVALGQRWEEIRADAEGTLIEAMDLPPAAVSAAISVDRVSLAMAEPRTRTPADDAAGVKKPTAVNFRMAFTGSLTLYDADGTSLSTIRYAHVPEGGAEAVEAALRRDLHVLLRRRPTLRIVTLADGAPEMQGILDRATVGMVVAARLVDFWHLAEHLGKALAAIGFFVPDQLGDWKSLLLERDDAAQSIESALARWAEGYRDDALPPALRAALTYIRNHRDRLQYAGPRAAQLPIGSGIVEATGKTIIEVRMKRAGARWQPAGAQAIMNLRALATSSSSRWDHAMSRILQSYTAPIMPLPPRPRRVRPART